MKFISKNPTAPGAYWFKKGDQSLHLNLVEIYDSAGRLFAWLDGKGYVDNVWQSWSGLWSSRLVPVDEVEMAFREGVMNVQLDLILGQKGNELPEIYYETSRARRVVEGREEL